MEHVFGPNFKIRCGVCMEMSGWVTNKEAKAWWDRHQFYTCHHIYAKFIRKFPQPA